MVSIRGITFIMDFMLILWIIFLFCFTFTVVNVKRVLLADVLNGQELFQFCMYAVVDVVLYLTWSIIYSCFVGLVPVCS